MVAPAAKASSTPRPTKPVKRTRMPPAATAAPPHLSSVQKGKRPRSSDAAEERPRRVKSSRGQKRSDAPTAADGKARQKDAAGGAATLAQAGEGGGAYRRIMFNSFVSQAFEKRLKGENEEYNQIISQFRALLPSASASQSASTSSAGPLTATPLTQLRAWLEALTAVVSKLDQSHAPLVETILAVPWAVTEESFVSTYMRFVGALISARTEWLKVVLERCVKGFKYRSTYTQASQHALPHLTRRLVYARIHALLRLLLSLVPTMSPSLSPLLALYFPSKRDPRAAQICYIDNLLLLTEYCTALSEDVLTLVVERALNIDVEIQGEPEDWEDIEEEMLAAAEAAEGPDGKKRAPDTVVRDVVDRPMEDDPDDSDSDDDDSDDEEGGLDLDNLSSDDDEPDPINDDDAARRVNGSNAGMSEAAIRKVLESRAKLDGILKVVLDHLAAAHADQRSLDRNNTSTVAPPAKPSADVFDSAFANAAAAESGSREVTPTADGPLPAEVVERRLTLFRTLLDIFDRTLLRTFKTRNVQFLLFYLCSLDVASSDHFIGVLLGRALFDQDAPSVTRVAAAGYVASFIARAQFVDASMTRKVMRHLCSFLEGQMDDYARVAALATSIKGAGPAPGGQELPVFYAVAQAAFYIFCFRWKDLLEEEDDLDDEAALFGLDAGRKWMMGLEALKKAVSSSFNPLKVCAQPVVNQFATIAHKTGFMYCFNILDSNRRAGSYRDPAAASAPPPPPHMPAPPLRSVSTSSLLNTLTAQQLHLSTPSPAGTPTPAAIPVAAPRQLLVAEEMDSFFPFDPFKLPLSSVYIDSIYREWEGADDDESTTSGDGSSSTADSDDDSEATTGDEDDDDDDEPAWVKTRGGLAVPGAGRVGEQDDEDDVSRSFEAMSLSLSPQDESFGGRRRKAMEAAKPRKAAKVGRVVG
ncbi:DNA independent RNA polymerase I transcription factor [Rhodotorula kratochvilovae]